MIAKCVDLMVQNNVEWNGRQNKKRIILKIVKPKSIEVTFIKLLPVFRDFVVSNTLIP